MNRTLSGRHDPAMIGVELHPPISSAMYLTKVFILSDSKINKRSLTFCRLLCFRYKFLGDIRLHEVSVIAFSYKMTYPTPCTFRRIQV